MSKPIKKIALSALVIAASGAYVWSQAGASDPLAQSMAGADVQTGSIQQRTLASTNGAVDVAPRVVPFVPPETTAPAAPGPAPSLAARPPVGPLPMLPAPTDDSVASSSAGAPPPADNTPAPTQVAVADAQSPAAPTPAPAQATALNIPLPRLRPPYRQVASAAPTPAPASAPASAPDPAGATSPLIRIAASTTGLNDGTYTGPVVDAYYGYIQIEAVIKNGRLTTIHVLKYPSDRRTSVFINRQALPMLRDEVISAQSANVDIVSGATLSSEAFIQSLGAALNKARA